MDGVSGDPFDQCDGKSLAFSRDHPEAGPDQAHRIYEESKLSSRLFLSDASVIWKYTFSEPANTQYRETCTQAEGVYVEFSGVLVCHNERDDPEDPEQIHVQVYENYGQCYPAGPECTQYSQNSSGSVKWFVERQEIDEMKCVLQDWTLNNLPSDEGIVEEFGNASPSSEASSESSTGASPMGGLLDPAASYLNGEPFDQCDRKSLAFFRIQPEAGPDQAYYNYLESKQSTRLHETDQIVLWKYGFPEDAVEAYRETCTQAGGVYTDFSGVLECQNQRKDDPSKLLVEIYEHFGQCFPAGPECAQYSQSPTGRVDWYVQNQAIDQMKCVLRENTLGNLPSDQSIVDGYLSGKTTPLIVSNNASSNSTLKIVITIVSLVVVGLLFANHRRRRQRQRLVRRQLGGGVAGNSKAVEDEDDEHYHNLRHRADSFEEIGLSDNNHNHATNDVELPRRVLLSV